MRHFLFLSTIVAVSFSVSAGEKQKKIEPFNGKDLKGWQTKEPKDRSHWKVGWARLHKTERGKFEIHKPSSDEPVQLINLQARGVDIYTEKKFGNVRIEVEVLVPKGSNSGVYVMGEYEVQVFDSYGKEKLGGGDMGAIYGAAPPKVNAIKAPGEWNKYVIDFYAPRFDKTGNKTKNALFKKVVLNGKVLHENVEMKGPTPSGVTGKEHATGPIMFQGDHGPVAYRNIKLTPLK